MLFYDTCMVISSMGLLFRPCTTMSSDDERKKQGLISLPPELVEKIFLHLDVEDIARLSCVCLAWREIANVDHIW